MPILIGFVAAIWVVLLGIFFRLGDIIHALGEMGNK
jgi:hypothetical protein